MNDKINGLIKNYVIWPELKNDFQKNINFSKMSMEHFTKEIENIPKTRKSIDTQIALFYLANERLSQARVDSQDVLGENELADYIFYQKTINKLSKELLAYITICSLVEARHNNAFHKINLNWSSYVSDRKKGYVDVAHLSPKEKLTSIREHELGQSFLNEYFSDYKVYCSQQEDFDKFLNFFFEIETTLKKSFKVKGGRSKGYRNIVENYLKNNLQEYTLGEVLLNLNIIFEVNPFKYGFGGSAWGQIARHGRNFVEGKINAEMFVDQSFSLEHNNGNMFNKDYLFNMPNIFYINIGFNKHQRYSEYYLDLNANDLILNAQHLGMVSGLLNIENKNKAFKKIPRQELFESFKAAHPQILINEQEFNKQHSMISHAYGYIAKSLNKVKKEVKESYPELIKSGKDYLDLEDLFTEIASRKECSFDVTSLKQKNKTKTYDNDSYDMFVFDLWNYVNKGNNIKPVKKTKRKVKFNVYDVENLPKKALDKNIVGGKAWGLAHMHSLGLPVPQAKVFGTDCCALYHQDKEKFNNELALVLPSIENSLKDENGNPILVSIRSGAPVSMPGMMDTVLNVGIDDSNYHYFCEKMGKEVTDKCAVKFMELFSSSNLGVKLPVSHNLTTTLAHFKSMLLQAGIEHSNKDFFPLNIKEQIKYSLEAVFDSWYSERAIAYRNEKGINHDMGTAAIIQRMVFGNLNENSCTGVVFSRDCLTGENKLVGEFLPKAQGEDVVSGSVTPSSIEQLKNFNKNVYKELCDIAKVLEQKTGQIQDIEFTVEDGKLYILQHRQAVCSPIAAVKILEDSTLDHSDLLKQIQPKVLQDSLSVASEEKIYASGLSANSGVLTGIIVQDEYDIERYKKEYQKDFESNPNFGYIFYSELTSPEHMPIMNKTHGFITEQGGFTSHAAIIARSLNKPCIVGIGNQQHFNVGDIITMDGESGKIWKGKQPLIKNTDLAKSAAQYLMKSHEIKVEEISEEIFNERLKEINEQNSSWVFSCDKTQYVENKAIKKEKFLDLGQRIAMLIAANNRSKNKLVA